jgi:hypothetical protein
MLAYEGGFSGTFKVLLVLHVLSAIVGLGGVLLNGFYGPNARREGVDQGARPDLRLRGGSRCRA